MSDIVENWIPIRLFEESYPDTNHKYHIKICNKVVVYIVAGNASTNNEDFVFFTLEDAYDFLG